MRENKSFCKLQSDKLGYLSSQPRYDRFDTSAYKVVFEFCTAFARPMIKCVHPKFKKNECILVPSASTCTEIIGENKNFRKLQSDELSPVMSCPGARNFRSLFASQNFDRGHSFLLPLSATGGGRKRPHFDISPY